MDIFEECAGINALHQSGDATAARDRLIHLLDYHRKQNIPYSFLVNHMIRESGLFQYLDPDTSSWQERFVYESFKVDIGQESPVTMHSEQSLVLKHLLAGDNIAVSAPTSFGKSLIIDAYIAIRKPKNVLILVPTVALTDETRRRMNRKFSDQYKIVTTGDVELGFKNILIFPQERAIQYYGKLKTLDLFVIDEFYKASQDFDKERSPALLKAMLKFGAIADQRYYLAPKFADLSSNPFTKGMLYLPLDFNTVFLRKHDLYYGIKGNAGKKRKTLIDILEKHKTKSLIYAGTYSGVKEVTNLLIERTEVINSELLESFSNWLKKNYDPSWLLADLVKRGVGIHTGQLHRSLSQIQIKLFEESLGLQTIISTSSIIEGVNTVAENVIVWSKKNGSTKLNDFTYRNIIGRGGRMLKYFIGEIYLLEQPPLPSETDLNLVLPDKLLAEVDEQEFKTELTNEQIAKIILYKEQMTATLGKEVFDRLRRDGSLISADTDLISNIIKAIAEDPKKWRGLKYLNSSEVDKWDWILKQVLKLAPPNHDTPPNKLIQFIKVLSNTWQYSTLELLSQLTAFELTINDFFKFERHATYKLPALLNDINILQRELLPEHNIDISPFIARLSKAFLPSCVIELEEYGLPRMIAKKLHAASIINFENNDLELHSVLQELIQVDPKIWDSIESLDRFDRYIIEYFLDGIIRKQ